MTFSIAAYDRASQAAGVATATGEMAVGAYVPYTKAGVGACLTQGNFTNWRYGEIALAELERGCSVDAIVSDLTRRDKGYQHRQFLIVDHEGAVAGWTGDRCARCKDQIHYNGFGVAGNILANRNVLKVMAKTFIELDGIELSKRLLLALEAGQNVGGDARGLISAALKVDHLDKPPVDLRIDFQPFDAITELHRLLKRITNSPFSEFYNSVPTRTDFSKPE